MNKKLVNKHFHKLESIPNMQKVKILIDVMTTKSNTFKDLSNSLIVFLIFLSLMCGCSPRSIPSNEAAERATVIQRVRNEGRALADVAPALQDDKEIVLEALEHDGLALEFASGRLRQDEEVVSAAVKQNGMALQFANEKMKCNGEIVERAIRNKPSSIQFVNEFAAGFLLSQPGGEALFQFTNESVQNNELLVMMVCKKNGELLQHASNALRDNAEVVLTAVNDTFKAFQYASDRLREDENTIIDAAIIDIRILEYVDEEVIHRSPILSYLNNKRLRSQSIYWYREAFLETFTGCCFTRNRGNGEDELLDHLRHNGLILQYASAELRNDREIVGAAVIQNGRALEHASAELRNDREIVSEAVRQNGLALQYASAALRNDREIVSEAVRQNGLALAYSRVVGHAYKEIALEAVKQNGLAAEYLVNFGEGGDMKEIMLASITQNGLALKFYIDRVTAPDLTESEQKEMINAATESLTDHISFTKYFIEIDYNNFLKPLTDSSVLCKQFVGYVLQRSDRLVLDTLNFTIQDDERSIRDIVDRVRGSIGLIGGRYQVFNINDFHLQDDDNEYRIELSTIGEMELVINIDRNATVDDLARQIAVQRAESYIYLVNQNGYSANPFNDDGIRPLQDFLDHSL